MKKLTYQSLGLLAAIAAVGCTDVSTEKVLPAADPAGADAPIVREAKSMEIPTPAGKYVSDAPDSPGLWAGLIKSRAFSARPDPFALQPKERTYEKSQTSERLFGTMGGFRYDFVPTPATVTIPQPEPQPYRRLAGVIVGDSVLALIDMGDGQLKLIRPGQDIEGWHVASIDSDKAVLTRGGNKLPHQVVVRLESPLPGSAGSGRGNSGGPGGPGGPPPGGGPPGMSPGGIGGGE